MAGIGFKMQKLFQEDYFSSRIRAYSFAGLVTSGPWIVVVLSITIMQWIIRSLAMIDNDVRELFVISISYCFIFSQIIFGAQQMIVTRYVADLFYTKKTEEIYGVFLGSSKLAAAAAVLLWLIFAIFSPLPILYKGVLLLLFVALNLIWVLFMFLTAAKYYQPVAYSFLAGGIVAVLTLLLFVYTIELAALPLHTGALFLLVAFTIGMLVTLFALYFALLISFPKRGVEGQFSYLQYYDRYPALFWIGFLYNIGVWVCNWIIWFGEGSLRIAGSFRYHAVYDTAIFFSYLTIIPTMVLFVISIETRFYQRYRTFYGYINEGGSLNQIQKAKRTMQIVLRQELERLLRKQGIFSAVVIAAALYFADELHLSAKFLGIFTITTVGAFSNGMVWILSLLLLYFEDQKGALHTTVLYLVLNLVLTLAFLPMGFNGYGLSFAIGSTIAFGFAAWRLSQYIKDVDFYAFVSQSGSKEEKRTFTNVGEVLNRIKL